MATTKEPYERYAQAVLYCMRKHQNQVRVDGSPYIAHPLRVSEILRSIGGIRDMDVIIAALLHDLIEDTDCEWASLAYRYGSHVADLVAQLSGDMRLPKKERREEIIARISNASADAKAIRLADKLDNLRDMEGFSDSRKQDYIRESRKILAACKGANSALETALEQTINKLGRSYNC